MNKQSVTTGQEASRSGSNEYLMNDSNTSMILNPFLISSQHRDSNMCQPSMMSRRPFAGLLPNGVRSPLDVVQSFECGLQISGRDGGRLRSEVWALTRPLFVLPPRNVIPCQMLPLDLEVGECTRHNKSESEPSVSS